MAYGSSEKGVIKLAGLRLSLRGLDSDLKSIEFTLQSGVKTFQLRAATTAERKLWVDKIDAWLAFLENN